MRPPSDRRKTFRHWIQQVHLWCGLTLCVPLVLLGLTGSILVFHEDIEGWTTGALPAAAKGEVQSAEAIVNAVLTAAPEGLMPVSIRFPVQEGDYASVRLTRMPATGQPNMPPGRMPGATYLVDPVSLSVIEQKPAASAALMRIFHNLHGNLMIEGRLGRQIVGWLGVVMLTLGISGLIIWWPRKGQWSTAFSVAKGARGFRLHRDLHGAAGFWGLIVFTIVSFTGVYIAFPETVAAGISMVFPGRDLRASANAIKIAPLEDVAPLGLDHEIVLAQEAVPDKRLVSIMLAQRPSQAVRVNFIESGAADGAPLTTVFIDPYRARIIETRDPHHYTIGETILAWQRALHEGSGLGLGWKIVVFLAGLLPLLFSITGFYMWWIKRKRRAFPS